MKDVSSEGSPTQHKSAYDIFQWQTRADHCVRSMVLVSKFNGMASLSIISGNGTHITIPAFTIQVHWISETSNSSDTISIVAVTRLVYA